MVYTASEAKRTMRRPNMSAVLPVMAGKIPEAIMYEVTVRFIFWMETPMS